MKKGIINKVMTTVLVSIMIFGSIGNLTLGKGLGIAPLTVYANEQSRPNQQAFPSGHTVLINGQPVSLQAYNIQGNNYFMLRDIAYALNGTDAQFSVNWSATWRAPYTSIRLRSGQPYEVVGGEMTGTSTGLESRAAIPTSEQIFHHSGGSMIYDGSYFRVHPRGYLIGNNNFFMLRELGDILGFDVDWDGATDTILVSTGEGVNLGNALAANVTSTDGNAQAPATTASHENQAAPQADSTTAQASNNLHPDLAFMLSDEYINAVRAEFYRLVNEHRRLNGLRELGVNLALQDYADVRAAEQRVSFGHTRPDGSAAGSGWFNSRNTINTSFAENASGFGALNPDPLAQANNIFNGWMNSPGHNRHLLYNFDAHIQMALGFYPEFYISNTGAQRVGSGVIFATGYVPN